MKEINASVSYSTEGEYVTGSFQRNFVLNTLNRAPSDNSERENNRQLNYVSYTMYKNTGICQPKKTLAYQIGYTS